MSDRVMTVPNEFRLCVVLMFQTVTTMLTVITLSLTLLLRTEVAAKSLAVTAEARAVIYPRLCTEWLQRLLGLNLMADLFR